MSSRKPLIRERVSSIAIDLLLTFIGVLAALAVENYRESLHEHEMEKEYLFAFRDALQSDTTAINLALQNSFHKLNAASQFIKLIESEKNSFSDEEFSETVQSILMLIDPAYNTSVYEDLRATGNSRIIRNIKLRNAIIAHYIFLNNLMAFQQKAIPILSYNAAFMSLLEYEEINSLQNLSYKKIISRFRKDKAAQLYLKQLQKELVIYRNGLLYSALPKTLNLLEMIEAELKTYE